MGWLAAPGPGGVGKQGDGGWWRVVEGGGGYAGAPRRYDGVGDLFPRDSTTQLLRKRGCRTCGLRLAAYGRDDLLRPVEQDRSVLQERPTPAHLRGADELPRADEEFAPDGSREAGGRAGGGGGGRGRAVGGQSWGHAQRAEHGRHPGVDRLVRSAQAAERRDRGCDRVGQLVLVPHRGTARWPPHDVDAATRHGGAVIAACGLVATEREARRVEPVEPQERLAHPVGPLQEGHVDGHVLGARAPPRLEQQLPPNGGRAPRGAAPAGGRAGLRGRRAAPPRATALSPLQARRLPSAGTPTPRCGRPRGRPPRPPPAPPPAA